MTIPARKMRDFDSGETVAWFTMFLVWFPVAYAVAGLAWSQMWMWFAVPLGAPAITAPHFVGLIAIAGLVEHRWQNVDERVRRATEANKDKGDWYLLGAMYGRTLAVHGIALSVGWMAHTAMVAP